MRLRRVVELSAVLSLGIVMGAVLVPPANTPSYGEAPQFIETEVLSASDVITLTNRERTSLGLPPLVAAASLNDYAASWSRTMGTGTGLSHSTLSFCSCTRGENVGIGPNVESIHNGFMGSPGHRANIVSTKFNRIGAGHYIDSRGVSWVTVVFAYIAPKPAPAPVVTPKPTPTPTKTSSAPKTKTVCREVPVS